jgi:hypothetical protein
MHTFEINVLVHFLVSCTCCEHNFFIMKKTMFTHSFVWYVEGCAPKSTSFHPLDFLHKCMKNIPYKTACTSGLPDDEHMMFETRRRRQEVN